MTTTATTSGTAAIGPPLPTPTFGPGGAFTITCSTRIAAPPSACLDVVVKASHYSTWNRFCRKCTIDAQPHDTAAAGAANTSTDTLRLGTEFTFDVHVDPSSPEGSTGRSTALQVSVLEPIDEEWRDDGFPSSSPSPLADATTDTGAAASPDRRRRRKGWRIAWTTRSNWLTPAWMLRAERVQEFIEVGDGSETAYYCWETFYGVLAPVIRMAVGKQVEGGFGMWMEGLKGRAEGSLA